jgi:hypothetical protein
LTAGQVPLTTTIGEGTASLSVANPVPAYTTSEGGKVLGVVDNAGTAELQWVNAGGGDTTVITYDSSSSAQAATIFATIGAAVTAGKPVILVDTINKTVATLSGYRNDDWGKYATFGSFTYDAGGQVKGRNYLCSPTNFNTNTLVGAVANPSFTWSLNNGHLETSTAGNIKDLCMVNIRANVGKDTLSGGEPSDKSILYATVSIGADYSYAPVCATAVGIVNNDGSSWNAVFSLAFNNVSYTSPTSKMYLSVQDASGNSVDISGSRVINVTVAS